MSGKPIRVLVVEDSPTVRAYLVQVLSSDPDLNVVGEAGDGRTAVALCARERPDVVTMDMMLPVMTGLAATEQIMAHHPTPILIVSASTNRGELFQTYQALAAGAVDVLEKPGAADAGPDWERNFTAAVKLVSRIRVITHLRGRIGGPRGQAAFGAAAVVDEPALAVVGASTGGPGALAEVLAALPASFTLPILFVLHIASAFGAAFVEWLGKQIGRPVLLAEDGLPLESIGARVVMAPPDRHLIVEHGRLRLTGEAERHSCRPSVDVLFESVAREMGSRTAAALLTGMGRDGAAGMLAIRRAGGLTIAKDGATSVVYGMPREAAALGGAQLILPLSEIGPALAHFAAGGRRSRGSRP
jgi:two-component system chemotaxis response regulator CheB